MYLFTYLSVPCSHICYSFSRQIHYDLLVSRASQKVSLHHMRFRDVQKLHLYLRENFEDFESILRQLEDHIFISSSQNIF